MRCYRPLQRRDAQEAYLQGQAVLFFARSRFGPDAPCTGAWVKSPARRDQRQVGATKGGAVLRTIGDVRTYMIATPAAHDGCARWLRAPKLILGQAEVADVSPAGAPCAVL